MAGVLPFSQTVFKALAWSLLALALLQGYPACSWAEESYDVGIVTANSLNVRAEPGLNEPPLTILGKGAKVRILEQLDGWIKISYRGYTGYVRNRSSYIRRIRLKMPEAPAAAEEQLTDIEQFKKQAETISKKIEKGQANVQDFIQKESAVINSLNSIDLALNAARERIAQLKSELPALEKQIAETIRASEDLTNRIETDQEYISKRLVSLYKLNWVGHLNILASADSIYDLFQRKKTLELILAYDRKVMSNLMQNKLDLQLMLTRLNAQKSEKISLETDLTQQIELMSQKRAQRSQLLDDIRSKKSLELAAIESLKQAAKDLDQAIQSLSSGAFVPEPDKKTPPKSFISLKGLLNMPVKGKIISFFGPFKNPKFNVVNFNSGIEIQADRGEPIHAVHDGKVLYASWFKGYGNIVIIDHDDNYYTVYAHAEEVFVSKGDRVESGEVVATVGDTGSLTGPNLHFEVRHFGKPIDPLKWIKNGA